MYTAPKCWQTPAPAGTLFGNFTKGLQHMARSLLLTVVVSGLTLLIVGPVPGDVPAPPVNQTIGMLDTVAGNLDEADCRVCHSSGVPDRHHNLYGEPIPGAPDDEIYTCLGCHGDNFTVVRDCLVCHNDGSPHHATEAAIALDCKSCHGDLVDNPGDDHYIPTYDPSLVTPYRGLNGDGYENAPYPTPDLQSDGSGSVAPADVTVTEAGPPFFTVTEIGPLGTVHTRNEPNQLKFKPAGDNNDFFIGSTHHGGEEYSVVFNAGSPTGASWDADSQTLTVTVDETQTAAELVSTINTATGEVDVEATLGYDGDDPEADRLPPEHYEPIGGDPPNSRGFGAGSCSYCHDTDGTLDDNGDPAGVIVNNHDTHHEIMGALGGFPARCNICHDYSTVGEQSGPNFDSAIRTCENCHGPDSLHNIQADSPNADNIGTIVVGGEDAGYGHVGRDAGPDDSDCWGCHGFPMAAAVKAPGSGPLIPTLYTSGLAMMNAGTDTTVTLNGSGFTNTAGNLRFESRVRLTADDGSTVTLNPDTMSQDLMTVTIPGTMAPGNYNVQAVKAEFASNPTVISVTPKVSISDATADAGRVTINGSGFGGYAEGSTTAVTGTDTSVNGAIVSWSDTTIVAEFDASPSEVTVDSVFGTVTSRVLGGGESGTFLRGDCNDDGTVNIADASRLLNWLFLDHSEPDCLAAANTNGENAIDITDAAYLVNFLFVGGSPLPPPYPACGTSDLPSDEELGCLTPPDNCR